MNAPPLNSADSPAQLLSQLRDIHLPPALPAWPPAYGWLILTVLMLFVITLLTAFCYRQYKRNAAKRDALKALDVLSHSEHTDQAILQALSILLRRVALSYDSTENIRGLYGQAWSAFLAKHFSGQDSVDCSAVFTDGAYRQDIVIDRKLLFMYARQWIKKFAIKNGSRISTMQRSSSGPRPLSFFRLNSDALAYQPNDKNND